MSDSVDEASVLVERYNAAPQVSSTKDWELLIEVGDEWQPHVVTGTLGAATDLLADLIDLHNGRWARGHSGKICAAASDGVAEQAWHRHFGKS